MPRSRLLLLVIGGVPPLALSALGLLHPHHLTDDTAALWRNLHIILLPIFPLLALAPWLVARRENRVVGWLVALLGYVFAAGYTALDVLAGIGAGALQADNGGMGKTVLYAEGNDLADYGVWAYLLAGVLASAVAIRRTGLVAVPGSLLVVVGAYLFLDSHIYWPTGGIAMLLLAAGWMYLLWEPTWNDRGRAPASSASGR